MSQGILEMLRSSPGRRNSQKSTVTKKAAPLKKAEPVIAISDSSSDEDDDPLAQLLAKSSRKLDVQTRKRPNMFEERDGRKVYKLPSPIKPPAFLSLSSLEMLRKSDELAKAHKDDDEQALKLIRGEEEFEKMLEKGLDKLALQNTVYVDYLKTHRNEMKLKDYYFFGKASAAYTQDDEDDLPAVMYAFPGILRPEIHNFDVINETDVTRVQIETSMLDNGHVTMKSLNKFLKGIGASTTDATITEEDMKLNSLQKLNPVALVMAQLNYLITQLSQSAYDQKLTERVISVLGRAMMDTRVFNCKCTEVIETMVTTLLNYIKKETEEEPYTVFINTWKPLTMIRSLQYRILESLPQVSNMDLITLRRLFSLSLLTTTPSPAQCSLPSQELDTMIYTTIANALDKFLQSDKDLTDDDYVEWTYNFKSILFCIKHGDQNPALADVGQAVELLKDAITISFQNQAQAVCRSMMMMVSMLLDDKEVRMKSVFD